MKRIGLVFVISVFFFGYQGVAQNTIEGTVKDENNNLLPSVNIVVQGTNDGAATDFDGKFKITTSKDFPFILEFSSIGFESTQIEVTDASNVDVVLKEGAQLMDEIVVSTSRKSERVIDAPASVSIISAPKTTSGNILLRYVVIVFRLEIIHW